MFNNHTIHDGDYYFELFYQIFNSMSDMVFLINVDQLNQYRYVFINEAANEKIGLTVDAFGKLIRECLPEEVFSNIQVKYDEAIYNKKPVTYEEKVEIPFRSDLQKTAYFKTTVTPVFNEQGKCTYIFSLVRDVTEEKEKESKLQQLAKHIELLWNRTADPMYVFDDKGKIIDVNIAYEKLFGWKKEEIFHESILEMIPDGNKQRVADIVATVKSGKAIPSYKTQRNTKDGKIIDVLASYSPIFSIDGKWSVAIAIYKDVTEHAKVIKELEKSEEKYRVITENSSDLIKVIDCKGIVQYISPSHKDLLGIQPKEILGKSILTSIYRDDIEVVESAIEKINSSRKSAAIDFRRYNDKGEVIWFHAIGTPILNETAEVDRIIFVEREINNRKIYEQKLKHYALHDSVTGVLNRIGFYKRLRKEMEQAKKDGSKLAVMMLDLDHFKSINDTMGHDIGDQLLIGFTKRVQSCLRKDDVLARLGGDEFIVLLPNLHNNQEAVQIANNIIRSLQQEWTFAGKKFTTTSSIGIAFYQQYHSNKKLLLKHADLALYQAKKSGRNMYQVFVSIE